MRGGLQGVSFVVSCMASITQYYSMLSGRASTIGIITVLCFWYLVALNSKEGRNPGMEGKR